MSAAGKATTGAKIKLQPNPKPSCHNQTKAMLMDRLKNTRSFIPCSQVASIQRSNFESVRI